MAIVFFHVGWMREYRGLANDSIKGGGGFVEEKGWGGEIFNFRNVRGKCYGYVMPGKHWILRIERLGADSDVECVDGIDVIWTAKRPTGGVYIIGWYKNARVYRKPQTSSPSMNRVYERQSLDFITSAKTVDCHVLCPDQRTFAIPQGPGWKGTSGNVWYADNNGNRSFVKKVRAYIKGLASLPPIKEKYERIGGGRSPDPEKRRKVEKRAIKAATRHFENMNYDVKTVEQDYVGWDLEATIKKKSLLRVEVKGLSGVEPVVDLTPNEYKMMMKYKSSYRIFIMTKALSSSPKCHCFQWSPYRDRGCWESEEGQVLEVEDVIAARLRVK